MDRVQTVAGNGCRRSPAERGVRSTSPSFAPLHVVLRGDVGWTPVSCRVRLVPYTRQNARSVMPTGAAGRA